jgi:archaellum component FlaG (FlaF/FlaG flagellin family)
MKKIIMFSMAMYMMSCGPKKATEVCAGSVRKEFDQDGVYATVEEGCVANYDKPNYYTAKGTVKLVVKDNGSERTIDLPKGTLVTKDGSFIIEGSREVVKVRLIGGSAKLKLGDKLTEMALNNVATIGG